MAQTNYQNLSKVNGSLYGDALYGSVRSNHISYDFEVPDNLVVASPGGVSTVHHHYTKGFNGRGNFSTDIYAGQGEQYISGIYGNLYNPGNEAGNALGMYSNLTPAYEYWLNQEPQTYSYNAYNPASNWAPTDNLPVIEKKTLPDQIEGFTPDAEDDDYELLDQIDGDVDENTEHYTGGASGTYTTTRYISPFYSVLLFILAVIVINVWIYTVYGFVKEKWYYDKDVYWQHMIVCSCALTLLFFIVVYFSGVIP